MKMNVWVIGLAAVFAFAACSDDDDSEGTEMPGKITVLEYCPAPGQFINEGMDCKTMKEANVWAEARFEKGYFVSLGSFGGYLTVQMPKVIKNRKGYDFAVIGNAMESSSEPGIVWVSEDKNGNGIADDVWYELKGSDFAASTREYAVTYRRPNVAGEISWTDNKGGSGVINYLPQYHDQMYYPAWVKENSYTLKGSSLEAKTEKVGGNWVNPKFGWGYADNLGSDMEKKTNGGYRYNQLDLDNAVDAAGEPVVLQQIHFVKVQSAILKNVETIGEVSTEVIGFKVF
ncbi:MAG: cell surface protein [Odoribacter sp.]